MRGTIVVVVAVVDTAEVSGATAVGPEVVDATSVAVGSDGPQAVANKANVTKARDERGVRTSRDGRHDAAIYGLRLAEHVASVASLAAFQPKCR